MLKSLTVEATFLDGLKTVHLEQSLINFFLLISYIKNIKKVIVKKPISAENADLDLVFFGSFLPIPSLDIFKGKEKLDNQNTDVNMSDDTIEHLAEDIHELYPGRIIPFKRAPVAVKDVLDEGEIDDEVQNLNSENQNEILDDKFIELNKDKGESVLLSVTNLSNESIKVE